MIHLTDAGNAGGSSNLFYLAPALTQVLSGTPLEQVNFLRDEMANLVWAVENRVPSQAGHGVSGDEMATPDEEPELFVPMNETVQIRYVAGTTVPHNWIPFIPVHMAGSEREVRLQRARMPAAKGALGVVLTEQAAPYYIAGEEVPRAGTMVRRSFQRARWLNGRTYCGSGGTGRPAKEKAGAICGSITSSTSRKTCNRTRHIRAASITAPAGAMR